jgi:hypothetical protein
MPKFIESSDVIELVLGYIGFSPQRFYLRQCSKEFEALVDPVMSVKADEFKKAMDRKLVNPNFLKLQKQVLSADLFHTVASSMRHGKCSMRLFKYLLDGRSVAEVEKLGKNALNEIIKCSLVNLDEGLYDLTAQCIKSEKKGWNLMPEFLYSTRVRVALMQADAVEWLKKINSKFTIRKKLKWELMEEAIAFGAEKCLRFLSSGKTEWKTLPRALSAVVHAGNLERLSQLFDAKGRKLDLYTIEDELHHAVELRHLEVADFLRKEWCRLYTDKKNFKIAYARLTYVLYEDIISGGVESFGVTKVVGEPSTELLDWLFADIPDLGNLGVVHSRHLLEIAVGERYRRVCHYLIKRGATSLSLCGRDIERKKLKSVVNFCCRLPFGDFEWQNSPKVQAFLLKKGLLRDQSLSIVKVLEHAYHAGTFSDCVEFVRNLLRRDPRLSKKLEKCSLIPHCPLNVTPLGLLALVGTPQIKAWTGKSVVGYSELVFQFEDKKKQPDEWNATQPNLKEIAAFKRIGQLLSSRGASPKRLFGPEVLHKMFMYLGGWHLDAIPKLIAGGADINYEEEGQASLELAASLGRSHGPMYVKKLLECGASLDKRRGMNAAEGCLLSRNWTSLKMLADAGVNVDTFPETHHSEMENLTPLQDAADQADFEMLQALLNCKADPNLPSRGRMQAPPLLWIMADKYAPERLQGAQLLLDHKADINAKDRSGRTALFRAAAMGDSEGIEWLLIKGANAKMADKNGARPIDIARFRADVGGRQELTDIAVRLERVVGPTKRKQIDGLACMKDLLEDYPDSLFGDESHYSYYDEDFMLDDSNQDWHDPIASIFDLLLRGGRRF